MILSFWVIILVVLICGIAGGYRNYLINMPEKGNRWSAYCRCMLEATGAAMVVPLFLSAIGNDITGTILDGRDPAKALYALIKLIGFCSLAAFYSVRFLDSASTRLLRLKLDKVDEASQATADEVAKLERFVVESKPKSLVRTDMVEELNDNQKLTLSSFRAGLPARSLEGLALSTGLAEERLEIVLEELCKKLLLQKTDTSRGLRWSITSEGLAALARI